MNVRLLPSALADIEKASAYYEGRAEGLGQKFVDRVLETVDRIGLNPLGYVPVIRDVRRANIRRFPYALFFKIEGDAVVIACLDSRRNPDLVRERISGVTEIRKGPEPA